jgi:hypothetical protein
VTRGKSGSAHECIVGSVGAEDLGDLVCGESTDLCMALLALGCGGGLGTCGVTGRLLG